MQRALRSELALALVMLAGCAPATSGAGGPEPGIRRPYEADGTVETRVLVPEVYELSNVVLAVTEYGREDPGAVYKEGAYYERVREHFDAHADDELVRTLDPLISASYANYYGFRENALSYEYDGSDLVHGERYYDVWRSPDLFARCRELVADFAEASDFRAFYAAERQTYEQQIARYRELVDLAGMAGWLHARFPDRRMDAYTVVFSPLILGSHSTRNFEVDGRREAVMFVSGPNIARDVGERVLRGMHERVVFTEIDHNYVNPVTNERAAEVRRVFRDWRAWNSGQGYASPVLTFNEYMTWAVFTLYAADAYEPEAFRELISRMERQMQERRAFVRFRAFNRELLRLYRERQPETVRELYAPILSWAARAYR